MATLGYMLVLFGLGCAVFTAVVGLVTGLLRKEGALPWVQRGMYGFCAAMVAANLVMVFSLVNHDFTVKYVQQVGSRSTPLLFTVVSLWSALEGSILFWGAIMGAYLFAFTFTYRKEHGRYMQLTLGVMGGVAAFFAFLIAAPAQPWFQPGHLFEVVNPVPLDGPGPNPLLQNHPLMIIHPPMLYLGYVGMTVPFGIAVGALLRGELGDAWMVPLRKWTLVPWMFLSVGIILGGWWAYAVLGWGGYWAWDPVENASFMPWLTSTAFMHSTMVLERKKSLKLWTIALALSSFVLTIIGTFMTRSGVFNSVHSFTQSDIGPTFLVFIAIITVFSIVLLAVRGNLLVAESSIESVVSREGAILVNNLVFVVLTATVFLGTTYPLVTEALEHKKISVGEPYFNTMALPTGILILFLMGVGPMLPWGAGSMKTVRQQLTVPTIAGAVTALVVQLMGFGGWLPLLTFAIAGFVTVVTVRAMVAPAMQRADDTKENLFRSFFVSAARTRRRTGGYVVHLGVVMVIVAIAASRAYPEHASQTLAKGQVMAVGPWKVRFDGISNGKDERRDWVSADVTVISPTGVETEHHGFGGPRMNYYPMSNDPVGSPLVQEMVIRDVYVSLQHIDSKTQSASFNAWVFPLVGWIWYALPVLVLGTLIALWPKRKERTVASAANPEVPGAAAGGAAS